MATPGPARRPIETGVRDVSGRRSPPPGRRPRPWPPRSRGCPGRPPPGPQTSDHVSGPRRCGSIGPVAAAAPELLGHVVQAVERHPEVLELVEEALEPEQAVSAPDHLRVEGENADPVVDRK